MELTSETYRHIVIYVAQREDLCTLCRVNKGFQWAAERALYNTIYTKNAWDTFVICSLLARTPRLAAIVEVLTLWIYNEQHGGSSLKSKNCLSNDFWSMISAALHHTTSLYCLNLHLDITVDAAQAWILNGTTFRLRSFRCDLQWDAHLVSFLDAQPDINDLYIVDYSFPETAIKTSSFSSSPLNPGALPTLSILECTFSEAACALLPARPISRLKTCFSKTRPEEKREELSVLFSKLMKTTCPLRSLDIADSTYSESFSMRLLTAVVKLQGHVHDLRYLGTLVLPIDGNLRLKFYGLLRALRSLQCVEVDVSEWDPSPTVPAGVRALASEMRLYCPTLQQVIFVNDFERTAITASHDTYAYLDSDTDAKNIWREF